MGSYVDQGSDISEILEKMIITHDDQHSEIKSKVDRAQLIR